MKSQIPKSFLYTISRRDLPLAQQAIQAGHAAIEYAYRFGRPADHHPSLIYLTAHDKNELEKIRARLHDAQIQTAEFHEPYKDWGLTSIGCILDEDSRHLLSGSPLWRLPTQTQLEK